MHRRTKAGWRSWRIGVGTATLAIVAASIVSGQEPRESVVSQMDALWAERANPGPMEQILALGEAAASRDYEVRWRMARARWWIGHSSDDLDLRRVACTEARALAREAQELRPDGVEAALVYAFAVGDYATSIGVARAVVEGVAGEVERAMRRAYELDRDYEDGSAMVALGRYYWRLPWPLRDLERSRALLEEVRARHPHNLIGRVFLAETYRDLGREEDALAELRFAVTTEPLPRRRPEDAPIQIDARRLLEKRQGG